MGSKWTTLPVKQVYKGLYDGPHATPKPSGFGPVFLGIKNIKEDGTLDLSEIRHISEEEYPKWIKRVEPMHGDIVFSYEATLNRYAIIPKGFRGCLGRRLALIRPDNSKINTRFLYYYFFSNEWRSIISQNTLTGSTVNRIPLTLFPDFPIRVPPLEEQYKIDSILSAYDDLIENNLRRIKILEEMSQNLYREWFVDFRFPGHENTRFIDSPLGQIPEGWEVENLFNIADVAYGYAFKSSLFNTDSLGKPVIRIRDVLAGISKTYTTEECKERYLVENGDILVGMDGDFHMGFWVGGQAYLVQRVARFRRKSELGNYLLFLSLIDPIKRFNATITGTTVAHLGDKHLKTINILMPDKEFLSYCNNIFEPLLRLIISLKLRNQVLQKTRDILLSKLISGEVDVSELDIKVPEEAAS